MYLALLKGNVFMIIGTHFYIVGQQVPIIVFFFFFIYIKEYCFYVKKRFPGSTSFSTSTPERLCVFVFRVTHYCW